jgi:hypothetical protein
MAALHHSSTHWFDEPLTDVSGSLRLVLIVAVVVVLTFIGVAWLCSQPPFRPISYYLQSPVLIQLTESQAPTASTARTAPTAPTATTAPPMRTPLPSP